MNVAYFVETLQVLNWFKIASIIFDLCCPLVGSMLSLVKSIMFWFIGWVDGTVHRKFRYNTFTSFWEDAHGFIFRWCYAWQDMHCVSRVIAWSHLSRTTDRNRWKTHQRFNGTGVKEKGMEGGREKGKNSWLDVSKKWVVYSYYCIWASPFLKGK